MGKQFVGGVIVLIIGAVSASLTHAEMTAEELAKLSQNPVGNLISVPFQNNTYPEFGPEEKTLNVLNIQPVIPVSINADWNVITRTILPVIHVPRLGPLVSSQSGIGDTTFTAFLSPSQPHGLIWGVGPVFQLPTHNSEELGNDNWGGGMSFVVLKMAPHDPWVFGLLANNVWSLTDDQNGGSYNKGLAQPFIHYNFKGGAYLTSAPTITVNWDATSENKWTVPMGGGVGKIFHFGKLPVNASVAAYYNIEKPEFAADWQIQVQAQLMFPEVADHPGGDAVSFFNDLLEKPATLSAESKYAVMNGYVYLSFGGLLIVWPGAVQTIFGDLPFVGNESALFRVLGMTVAVIGWLYVFGGRSGARQFGPASIVDRVTIVPLVLVPVAMAGVFPHIFLAFAVLDPALAFGAWVLYNRTT